MMNQTTPGRQDCPDDTHILIADTHPSTANITGEYIYGVLSTYPVLNSLTMYTTSMSAALDTLSSVTRNNDW